jgi:hypothetical protein
MRRRKNFPHPNRPDQDENKKAAEINEQTISLKPSFMSGYESFPNTNPPEARRSVQAGARIHPPSGAHMAETNTSANQSLLGKSQVSPRRVRASLFCLSLT